MAKLNGSYVTPSSVQVDYQRRRKPRLESGETSQEAVFFYGSAILIGFLAEWVIMLAMGF